ncbi:ANTR protein, partial [Illadopsis cleaveri]|nr:ANTR protein [Illadopsis cleaveri]
MKVPLCLGLVLALAVTACLCLPRPAPEAPAALGDPHQHPPSLVRRDWPQYLSQEQQRHLSQFLPHILTELNKHKAFVHEDEGMEALHDHYYPDWMDFGRRSAEDEAGA